MHYYNDKKYKGCATALFRIYMYVHGLCGSRCKTKREDFTGLTISARHAITTPLILLNVINTYIAHAN